MPFDMSWPSITIFAERVKILMQLIGQFKPFLTKVKEKDHLTELKSIETVSAYVSLQTKPHFYGIAFHIIGR